MCVVCQGCCGTESFVECVTVIAQDMVKRTRTGAKYWQEREMRDRPFHMCSVLYCLCPFITCTHMHVHFTTGSLLLSGCLLNLQYVLLTIKTNNSRSTLTLSNSMILYLFSPHYRCYCIAQWTEHQVYQIYLSRFYMVVFFFFFYAFLYTLLTQ